MSQTSEHLLECEPSRERESLPGSVASARSSGKKRRVIFNYDAHGPITEADGDLQKFIDHMFLGVENSQVDALFFTDGALERLFEKIAKSYKVE